MTTCGATPCRESARREYVVSHLFGLTAVGLFTAMFIDRVRLANTRLFASRDWSHNRPLQVHQTTVGGCCREIFLSVHSLGRRRKRHTELMALEPRGTQCSRHDAKAGPDGADFGKPGDGRRWRSHTSWHCVDDCRGGIAWTRGGSRHPGRRVLLGFLIAHGRREYEISLRPYIHAA